MSITALQEASELEESGIPPGIVPDDGDSMPFTRDDPEYPHVDLENSTIAITFTFNSIPDPLDIAKIKYGLIAPVITRTYSEPSAAAYFRRISTIPVTFPDGSSHSFSEYTFEKWVAIYREKGLEGLKRQVRSDKGGSRVLNTGAIEELEELIARYPKLPCTGLREKLIILGVIGEEVHVRTIQRYVKAHNLRIEAEKQVKERRAFEADCFGKIWQCDTCYTSYITENGHTKRTYLIIIVDDHSRMLLSGEFFYEDNAVNFQKVFKRAVEIYGIPDILYSDHGASYENKQLELITAELGTLHRLAPVRDGASKGKVERTFLTIKRRWLYGLDIDGITSLVQFNTVFREYIRKHNTTVNRRTGETPLSRYLNTRDHIRPVQSLEWVAECFKNRITRKVRRDSCVSYKKIPYDCPQQFIGQYVEIRFDPEDTEWEHAYIYSDNSKYPIQRTDKTANSNGHRKSSTGRLQLTYSED